MQKIFLSLLFFLCLCLSAQAEDDVLKEVYVNLGRDYINEISPKDITIKGLKSLEQTDPELKLSDTQDKLYLYQKGKLITTFSFPTAEADLDSWVAFSRKVIDTGITLSPEVELMDFDMPDHFARAVFKGLDGYSHYYGALSEDHEKNVVRRNYATRMVDNVMLIKILAFRPEVSQKVRTAVEDCSNCRGFILDLRGNHGGVLDEAIQIADLFLDEGIIAYTLEKDGAPPKYYTATAGEIAPRKMLVVLIDGLSASASEVLAGALSDQNRAILIGTKSFGKGTVQDVFKLGGHRAMALTRAFFYTPSGQKIDQNGLMPAICTGGLQDGDDPTSGTCSPADRFNQETDVEIAVKYIKNEL